MPLNLKDFSEFSGEIHINLETIVQLKSNITPKSNINDDTSNIDKIYDEFKSIGKRSVALRTKSWAILGGMIVELGKKYDTITVINGNKQSWSDYCADHFKSFKNRRRQQAVRLFRYGENLEQYYFLGIDMVLTVFNKLINIKNKEREKLKTIFEMYDFKLKDVEVETEEQQYEFKHKLTAVIKAFEHIEEQEKLGLNVDLYYRYIRVGCSMNKNVQSELSNMATPEEKNNFLLRGIANRGITESEDAKDPTYKSTIGLLCKLSQSINEYKSDKLNIPGSIPSDLISDVIDGLEWLKSKKDSSSEN